MKKKIEMIGQIFYGKFAELLIRQKSDEEIELGELMISEFDNGYTILQAYSLEYGSQIPQDRLELMSGLNVEKGKTKLTLMEPEMRNYVIVTAKALINVFYDEGENKILKIPKNIPKFFNNIRRINKDDLDFLKTTENPIYIGKIRSGSKTIDVDVSLPGDKIFKHHILIPATTGRGKSNLVKVFTYMNLEQKDLGMLLIDPHDEYYGTVGYGLKDHPNINDNLLYYSNKSNIPSGGITLAINIKEIKPWHLNVLQFSNAQNDAMYVYFNKYGDNWINHILDKDIDIPENIYPATIGVLRRKINNNIGLYIDLSGNVTSRSIFHKNSGKTTVNDIIKGLENGKKIVIDTSLLSNSTEIIMNSIIINKLFNLYKHYKGKGELKNKPTISIMIEEAPRVIGKKALEDKKDNIFGKIAREGRKFKIGLIGVTQLPSEIPREILANMNTKIILGNEMISERRAIMDSASQDLSDDNKTIASLDIGEGIISSNFTKFAIPVTIPLFDDVVREKMKKKRKTKPAIPE